MRPLVLTLTSAVILAATAATVYVVQRRAGEPHRYVENTRRLDYAPPPITRPNAPTEVGDSTAKPLEGFIAEADLPLGSPVVWLGVGDSTTLFIQDAFDRTGRRIVGAPVQVNFAPERLPEVADKHGLVLFLTERAGRHTIVASLRGKSDTMMVQVLPSAR